MSLVPEESPTLGALPDLTDQKKKNVSFKCERSFICEGMYLSKQGKLGRVNSSKVEESLQLTSPLLKQLSKTKSSPNSSPKFRENLTQTDESNPLPQIEVTEVGHPTINEVNS